MLVFISYPREFEAVAVALDAELKCRNIATFIDKDSIDLTDVWRLKIESNIRKAGVFVVLYRPEAATPDRFFLIETERIKKTCENNPLHRLITVLFPPTALKDLPPFFRNHQILFAEAQGDCEDERDGYWIDRVVQKVERLNEIERLEEIEKQKLKEEKSQEIEEIRKNNKKRQIMARTALAAGGIIIAALYLKLDTTKKELEVAHNQGESICHSLIGTYGLHQNYVFTEGLDTRSIAKNATWNANGCEYKAGNESFILKGEDVTYFDIEVIINNKYERIATATYSYQSDVSISKDGKLLGRTFEIVKFPQKITKFYKDRYGNSFNKSENFLDKKINEVIEISMDHETQVGSLKGNGYNIYQPGPNFPINVPIVKPVIPINMAKKTKYPILIFNLTKRVPIKYQMAAKAILNKSPDIPRP